MKAKILWRQLIAVIAVSGALLSGCAAMRKDEAMSVERTLAAAGFQLKFADTPERIDELAILPQRTLVPQQRDGELFYVYADPEYCKCLYVGTEAAYQRYQKLALQQKLAKERVEAAQMNDDASMNWGMWGDGWGPWY
jgi:hypothetical protein